MSDAYNAIVDVELQLKDAGAVTATAAAQVGGSDQILDLGDGFWEGQLVLDVSAVTVSNGDEGYTVVLQGSSSPTFASDVHELHVERMGHSSVTTNSASTATGRVVRPVDNRPSKANKLRYIRIYTVVAGVASPSINFTARLSK